MSLTDTLYQVRRETERRRDVEVREKKEKRRGERGRLKSSSSQLLVQFLYRGKKRRKKERHALVSM